MLRSIIQVFAPCGMLVSLVQKCLFLNLHIPVKKAESTTRFDRL